MFKYAFWWCITVLGVDKTVSKEQMFRRGRVAQLVEVHRLPETSPTGERTPLPVTILTNVRCLYPDLNSTLHLCLRVTSILGKSPYAPVLFGHS